MAIGIGLWGGWGSNADLMVIESCVPFPFVAGENDSAIRPEALALGDTTGAHGRSAPTVFHR